MNIIKLKATVKWANLKVANELSGKFQVNLCNLSDAAVAALKEDGMAVMNKEGDGNYITCKSTLPIKVYDKDGVEILDNVGNGSQCIAAVVGYEWKFKNKTGVSPSLKSFVITELVQFGNGPMDIDLEDLL